MTRARIERRSATTVTVDDEELLAFAGCDYLGLAHHPRVHAAVVSALPASGTSAGASRETTGNHVAHERLEEALAEFLGTESALLTTDGYLADLALAQGLADRIGVCLIDADAHTSLFDATRLTGTETHDYGPGDMTRAHALIDRFRERGVAVWTDGVFPMHGRIAATNELLRVLPSTSSWLIVDDSHTLGVLGGTGRGTTELFALEDPRLVVTASLGKGLGVAGGVIAGSAEVIARVRRRADAYVGSTPIPAALAAGGLAALDVLQGEPERVERLHANVAQLHQIGRRLGHTPRGSFLPVLPLPGADPEEGDRRVAALRARGLFVPLVHYPGAPEGGALRIAVSSEHTSADLRRLEEALASLP